ncbi:hypothetical protein D3C75_791010 [compost metagenome]
MAEYFTLADSGFFNHPVPQLFITNQWITEVLVHAEILRHLNHPDGFAGAVIVLVDDRGQRVMPDGISTHASARWVFPDHMQDCCINREANVEGVVCVVGFDTRHGPAWLVVFHDRCLTDVGSIHRGSCSTYCTAERIGSKLTQ